MNLPLAYSTNAYLHCDVFEAIHRVAALGFCGIELMADAPHLWPQETSPEKIDAVLRALGEHGLAISNINAFMMNRIGDARQPYWHPSWIEPDKAYRQMRIDHTVAALTMARQLGAKCITTEPGGPLEPGQSFDAALDQFVEGLRPVLEHAEREQVMLLVEPEPGLLIEKFEQYLRLKERLPSPWLGLNFDVGHAYCVGQEPADWIPRLADHTRHYHLEDIAASRVHQHLIPGHGAIDFARTLAAIPRDYFETEGNWLTIELYPYVDDPDAAGRAAKVHLETIAAAVP